MRPLRLKIRNIASLKGEHTISFQEIQEQSSLFAITGETGAGKSSILNSIGLALYGQVYKKNVNQIDVVTLGEKDGSIELIFQVKGDYYLADWKARVRKQNGEPYSAPQTPVRNLYLLETPDFDSVKNISPIGVPELLNLDFDQFCKCIILNQGEFARFITSSFSERKEILEKLYPGELLESMNKELYSELEALKNARAEIDIKLGELKSSFESGPDLKVEKERLEIQLKELEEKASRVEKLDHHFVSLLSAYDKFSENEQKKENVRKELALETSRLNELVKSGESIQDGLLRLKERQEKEFPELQIFLKKEENLKGLLESRERTQRNLRDNIAEDQKIKDKIIYKESEEQKFLKAKEKLATEFTFPLEDLKRSRPHLQTLFDQFNEKEVLNEELKGKALRLGQFETNGKELKVQYEELEKKIALIPQNIKELEEKARKDKEELQSKIEIKQRSQIKHDEFVKQIAVAREELLKLTEKVSALQNLIVVTQEELFPLEATLKLQEVLNAQALCLDHALTTQTGACPVCEQTVETPRWLELKDKFLKTDLESIRRRFEQGQKILIKAQEEEKIYTQKILGQKGEIENKEKEVKQLIPFLELSVPSLQELELKLNLLQKQSWELATYQKELETKRSELQRTREQYAKLKAEISSREELLQSINTKLDEKEKLLKGLVLAINQDSIRDLKREGALLQAFIDNEVALDKISQEKTYLLQEVGKLATMRKTILQDEEAENKKISALEVELNSALKGKKASELIKELTDLLHKAQEQWRNQEQKLKTQELLLKDLNGRLYPLMELSKDYDLIFTREIHLIKEIAGEFTDDKFHKLKDFSLTFSSPRELFIPFEELLRAEKEIMKSSVNSCRMNFASVSTRLQDWEKTQDKIQLFELQYRELNEALARKQRLSEVLGKDELRTFVLSLVEENLIYQTNEELQKLCQGRYEIIHQTRSLKMTPEFFILDKFREGGRRKVSTLSGGETFMVSLAMALALAEMTRGQAEIDSLFIDEGFGTLDQESLEDVLSMLGQIQNRGLLVGIISHIKALTNALPVNLVLNKRQDGTSSLKIQYN